MTNWTREELDSVRRMIEKAEKDPDFTATDVEVLKKVVEVAQGLGVFGRFTKWVIFILAALAGGLAAAEEIMEKARLWFSG